MAELSSGEAVLLKGKVMNDKVDHDKPIFEFGESDQSLIYPANHQALERFADFCRRSGRFEVR